MWLVYHECLAQMVHVKSDPSECRDWGFLTEFCIAPWLAQHLWSQTKAQVGEEGRETDVWEEMRHCSDSGHTHCLHRLSPPEQHQFPSIDRWISCFSTNSASISSPSWRHMVSQSQSRLLLCPLPLITDHSYSAKLSALLRRDPVRNCWHFHHHAITYTWPVSWATTKAEEKPSSWFRVQLLSGWHIPVTGA